MINTNILSTFKNISNSFFSSLSGKYFFELPNKEKLKILLLQLVTKEFVHLNPRSWSRVSAPVDITIPFPFPLSTLQPINMRFFVFRGFSLLVHSGCTYSSY